MRKIVKRTSKLWKNQIRLIAVRKQNVSLYKPVTSNKLNYSCFCHTMNILLTELSRSVWENLDLGRVATSVKILPYRPLARLIRAKCKLHCYKASVKQSYFLPLQHFLRNDTNTKAVDEEVSLFLFIESTKLELTSCAFLIIEHLQ